MRLPVVARLAICERAALCAPPAATVVCAPPLGNTDPIVAMGVVGITAWSVRSLALPEPLPGAVALEPTICPLPPPPPPPELGLVVCTAPPPPPEVEEVVVVVEVFAVVVAVDVAVEPVPDVEVAIEAEMVNVLIVVLVPALLPACTSNRYAPLGRIKFCGEAHP